MSWKKWSGRAVEGGKIVNSARFYTRYRGNLKVVLRVKKRPQDGGDALLTSVVEVPVPDQTYEATLSHTDSIRAMQGKMAKTVAEDFEKRIKKHLSDVDRNAFRRTMAYETTAGMAAYLTPLRKTLIEQVYNLTSQSDELDQLIDTVEAITAFVELGLLDALDQINPDMQAALARFRRAKLFLGEAGVKAGFQETLKGLSDDISAPLGDQGLYGLGGKCLDQLDLAAWDFMASLYDLLLLVADTQDTAEIDRFNATSADLKSAQAMLQGLLAYSQTYQDSTDLTG